MYSRKKINLDITFIQYNSFTKRDGFLQIALQLTFSKTAFLSNDTTLTKSGYQLYHIWRIRKDGGGGGSGEASGEMRQSKYRGNKREKRKKQIYNIYICLTFMFILI